MTSQRKQPKTAIPTGDDSYIFRIWDNFKIACWDNLKIVALVIGLLLGELVIVFVLAQILSKYGYRVERASDHDFNGTQLLRKGDLDGAIAEYRIALQLNPNDGPTHDELGVVLEKKGDLEGAIAEYRKATLISPKDPAPWNNLAWIFATTKDSRFINPIAALEYAQKSVRLSESKDASVLDTLAEAYFVNGNYDQAIETERKALALDPYNGSLKDNLAKYRQANQPKR